MRKLTILLVLTLACTAFAQDAFFVETPVAPVIDGASEAAWDASFVITYTNDDFQVSAGSAPSGAGDLDVEFRAMWDATNLYIQTIPGVGYHLAAAS